MLISCHRFSVPAAGLIHKSTMTLILSEWIMTLLPQYKSYEKSTTLWLYQTHGPSRHPSNNDCSGVYCNFSLLPLDSFVLNTEYNEVSPHNNNVSQYWRDFWDDAHSAVFIIGVPSTQYSDFFFGIRLNYLTRLTILPTEFKLRSTLKLEFKNKI